MKRPPKLSPWQCSADTQTATQLWRVAEQIKQLRQEQKHLLGKVPSGTYATSVPEVFVRVSSKTVQGGVSMRALRKWVTPEVVSRCRLPARVGRVVQIITVGEEAQ